MKRLITDGTIFLDLDLDYARGRIWLHCSDRAMQ